MVRDPDGAIITDTHFTPNDPSRSAFNAGDQGKDLRIDVARQLDASSHGPFTFTCTSSSFRRFTNAGDVITFRVQPGRLQPYFGDYAGWTVNSATAGQPVPAQTMALNSVAI